MIPPGWVLINDSLMDIIEQTSDRVIGGLLTCGQGGPSIETEGIGRED
jgi:hypothetical protein